MKTLFEQALSQMPGIKESWGADNQDAFSKIFDEEVPSQGPAKTMYGEVIRAINRLCYRFWNDGDRFFEGYGIETCGDAALWLMDNAPATIAKHIEKMEWADEDKYDAMADELVALAVSIDPTQIERLRAMPAEDHQDLRMSRDVIERWGDPDAADRCDECGEYHENCTCNNCPSCGCDPCECYDDEEEDDDE
jgi:hypothetical protein